MPRWFSKDTLKLVGWWISLILLAGLVATITLHSLRPSINFMMPHTPKYCDTPRELIAVIYCQTDSGTPKLPGFNLHWSLGVSKWEGRFTLLAYWVLSIASFILAPWHPVWRRGAWLIRTLFVLLLVGWAALAVSLFHAFQQLKPTIWEGGAALNGYIFLFLVLFPSVLHTFFFFGKGDRFFQVYLPGSLRGQWRIPLSTSTPSSSTLPGATTGVGPNDEKLVDVRFVEDPHSNQGTLYLLETCPNTDTLQVRCLTLDSSHYPTEDKPPQFVKVFDVGHCLLRIKKSQRDMGVFSYELKDCKLSVKLSVEDSSTGLFDPRYEACGTFSVQVSTAHPGGYNICFERDTPVPPPATTGGATSSPSNQSQRVSATPQPQAKARGRQPQGSGKTSGSPTPRPAPTAGSASLTGAVRLLTVYLKGEKLYLLCAVGVEGAGGSWNLVMLIWHFAQSEFTLDRCEQLLAHPPSKLFRNIAFYVSEAQFVVRIPEGFLDDEAGSKWRFPKATEDDAIQYAEEHEAVICACHKKRGHSPITFDFYAPNYEDVFSIPLKGYAHRSDLVFDVNWKTKQLFVLSTDKQELLITDILAISYPARLRQLLG